jgi:uncharacterized protein
MNIAIIGASADRKKFSNKCLRAYKSKGYGTFPVNPGEEEIEGLKCYESIKDIPQKIDIVSVYLPPRICKKIVVEILSKKPETVYMNPGTWDEKIENELNNGGIKVKKECSILAIGIDPYTLD